MFDDPVISLVIGALAALALLIGGLLVRDMANDRDIAKAQDPIATACALGRKDVCVLMGQRK